MQAKEILRPSETRVTVGKEGRHYKINSLIKVQHERFMMGIGSGEIAEVFFSGSRMTGFRTLERFDLAVGTNYIVEYQIVTVNQNRVVKRDIVSSGEYTNIITLKNMEDLGSVDVPEIGNIVSVSTKDSKLFLVGGGATETAEEYELPLVDYNDAIYDIGKIPPYHEAPEIHPKSIRFV
jgi:hypothetical protein